MVHKLFVKAGTMFLPWNIYLIKTYKCVLMVIFIPPEISYIQCYHILDVLHIKAVVLPAWGFLPIGKPIIRVTCRYGDYLLYLHCLRRYSYCMQPVMSPAHALWRNGILIPSLQSFVPRSVTLARRAGVMLLWHGQSDGWVAQTRKEEQLKMEALFVVTARHWEALF